MDENKINNQESTCFKSISNLNETDIYKISKIEFNKEELLKTLEMTQALLKQSCE